MRDRRAAGRRFGSARSSWFHCRRARCAAPARRTPGTAVGSVRALRLERGDPVGPAARARRVFAQADDPFGHHVAHGLVQARDLFVGQPARQHDRRQPRAVQDLVGIRVADAAEQARVGQAALDGVVLGLQLARERGHVGLQHIDAAWVHCLQRLAPGHQMDRCAALGAGLGQHQRTGVEREGGECALGGRLGAGREPAQAAGDHQMDDQEQWRAIAGLQRQHHALAEPLDAEDTRAFRLRDRRQRGAQHERVEHAHALQRVALHLGGEALDVDRDVGQLRHARSVPRRAASRLIRRRLAAVRACGHATSRR
jgi:hypothetical protein